MIIMPKKYSVEFKQRVVEAVIRDSRPIADVAREYGLVAQTLRVLGRGVSQNAPRTRKRAIGVRTRTTEAARTRKP